MTRDKSRVSDIVRLGHELKQRGFSVYAHPQFGGVVPGAHDPQGAHYAGDGEALDVGRDSGGPVSVAEQRALDRLAVELDARRFAVIWWRGPGDHQDHLHVATSRWRGRQGYSYRLSGSRQSVALNVDGLWGPKTWAGLSWALNVPTPARPAFELANGTTRALQRQLRTEAAADSLEVDGLLGRRTWAALATRLGVVAGTGPTVSLSSVSAVLQLRIHALGRVV